MDPKNSLFMWDLEKSKGLRFDFRGPKFWQRGVDCIMSSPNADLIAVSLACPKDVKSPYIMYRASYSLQLSSSL